ncbi:hypothetical protein FB451DRAFT_1471472 [Mycena latifolia]|nr:hypothetical protein FB451DRAFT_1471472 [Mycena latifolia]
MANAPKHARSASSEPHPGDQTAGKKRRKSNPQPPSTPPPRKRHVHVALPDSDNEMPAALAPKPPTRPQAGRPAHKDRGVRKDTASSANLTGLIPPHTPPQKPKKKDPQHEQGNAFSPHTSALLNFATAVPIHLQASPAGPHTTEPRAGRTASTSKNSGKVRLGLNALQHRSDKGWNSAGRASTIEAYKRFEEWKNDYSPQHYGLAECVDIVHAGNPFDRPKDIRARPVMFCWNTRDRRPPPELKGARVPVFRTKFKCTGHCRHGQKTTAESDEESSDSDSDSDDDDDETGGERVLADLDEVAYVEIEDGDHNVSDSESEEERDDEPDLPNIDPSTTNNVTLLNKFLNAGARKKAKTKGLPRFKCKVVLHAEVYSDDLGEMYFFQRHKHPEALEKYLDTSHYIRQCMLEMASLFNLPPSSIKRRLLGLLATFKANNTPTYRRPNAAQVNNVVNYLRRKERVLADPLLSIGVFAEHNPDKIFHYTPPNYDTSPPSEFATGIHNPYGTQVMMLHSTPNGVGHDTTYHNMNQNRAPLTIMITIDENGRMVPGFAYLSADIKIPTQADFLRESKRLVEKMAADLVAGRVPVAAGLEDKKDELMAKAKFIVKYGWRPTFFMIDKSRAAKAAIEEGIPIRICQFHVMQKYRIPNLSLEAILRWERDNAPAGERQSRPVLSVHRKRQLLAAVREVQRCRDIRLWDRYTRRFRRRLDAIAAGSATTAEALWDYFEANWFCEEWRDYWTDMGLPAGRNRDGMLSTNNWTERAFKTFNQVFLGNCTNKSAYRLVLILANEWFQYYQAWPAQNRVNQEALDMAAEAHRVWSSTNAIQPTQRSDGRQAWRVARLPGAVRNT